MRWFDSQEEALVQFIRTPGFLYELRRCAAAFALLIPLGLVLGLAFPEVRDALLGQLLVQPEDAASYSAMDALNSALTACGMSILCGVIPFAYLPALSLGSNALLIGAMAVWYPAHGHSLALYLSAVLPHGVFLLPAMVLCCAAGMYLCGEITRRCRGDKSGPPLLQTVSQIGGVYLLLAFPVLCAAALMEVHVTPRLMSLFL